MSRHEELEQRSKVETYNGSEHSQNIRIIKSPVICAFNVIYVVYIIEVIILLASGTHCDETILRKKKWLSETDEE